MASPKKAADRTPLENARQAHDKAKSELTAATQAVGNLRLEESKVRVDRGDDGELQARVRMLSAERVVLEREKDVFDAGVALNAELLAEASKDPDVLGGDVAATLGDVVKLHDLAKQYRADAVAIVAETFSTGADPTTIVGKAAACVQMAAQAEQLVRARITHAIDCRNRLRSRRRLAGEPLPALFPVANIDSVEAWIVALTGALDVQPEPKKNFVSLIAFKRREEDLARAELQQRALDKMAAVEREKNRLKNEREDQERRAAAAAKDRAARQAEADAVRAEMTRLAEQHRATHG
jgi:hypothetical protein